MYVGRDDVEDISHDEDEMRRESRCGCDAVLEEWDSVWTIEGYVQNANDAALAPASEVQRLVWDGHVFLKDLRGDVHQVYMESGVDCTKFTRRYGDQDTQSIIIGGVKVLACVRSLVER